jgi:hypothetical protein
MDEFVAGEWNLLESRRGINDVQCGNPELIRSIPLGRTMTVYAPPARNLRNIRSPGRRKRPGVFLQRNTPSQ